MKSRSIALITGIVFLLLYTASFLLLQKSRHSLMLQSQVSPLFSLPPVVLKAIAGEFKGLIADYGVMEVGSIIGKKEKVTKDEWRTVERLFSQSLELDPYFEQTLMLIQGTLPWNTQDYEYTISLLEISKEHRYWDWFPGFFIGFDYFYFLKDNLKASEALMAASEVKDAPPALATFGARLAQEGGENETAIAFLRMMLEKEKDKDKRDMLQLRLDAHLAVAVLEKGLSIYHDKHGKNPESLNTLVVSGVLNRLPENPYGKPFIYDKAKGSIKF